ncbi:MAG: ATPase [Erythrobacter sp.]|nr:ATPase [Erythrobacter sp.]
MTETDDNLARIAAALEQLGPPTTLPSDWLVHPAYVWSGEEVREMRTIDAPALAQLRGIDHQKNALCANITRLALGHAAHDVLLWGARGMGKSALLRAAVKEAQAGDPAALALVQVAADALGRLPDLFHTLAPLHRRFIIFIDDLGFAEDDTLGPRRLRSWLEGGVEARPANARLAVTANRRAILARHAHEQDTSSGDGPLNERDALDDRLALADRFGLSLGFHPCSKEAYLEIVSGYAQPLALDFDAEEALAWAISRGQRSGRSAWQFVVELAGRAGKAL